MKKQKNHIVRRVYQDMWEHDKFIILFNIFSDIARAIRPYVYIIFPAIILDQLLRGESLKVTAIWAVCGVLLQGFLCWLVSSLNDVNMEKRDGCNMMEKNRITEKLMRMDYAMLESGEYAKTVARHRGETSMRGGVYQRCLDFLESNLTAAIEVMVAVITLGGFWSVLFAASGESFLGTAWFSLIIIVGTVLACLLIVFVRGRIHKGSRKLRDQYADIDRTYEYYRDMILNYKTGKEIRVFKLQPFIMDYATKDLLSNGLRLQRRIARRTAIADGLGVIVFSVITFGTYLLVGVKAFGGLFSIGNLIIYAGALVQLIRAIQKLAENLGNLEDIRPRAELYYAVIDAQAPGSEQEKKEAIPAAQAHTIEYKDVSFHYEEAPGQDVLQHVNLTIHPGERIAVVGENGSGKTTLIKLLCGLHHPQSGHILLDGQNIEMYDSKAYQKLFAVVFQDYAIYSLALGENVATNEEYDKEKVNAILKQVGFPGKYELDTMLYQDCDSSGVEISGGEAQKLALARALYKDADIIVLDEPTSALDPFAEMALYSQFDELVQNKTSVYISHRLSSCRFCDRIIVMDHGRIVQSGSHDELVSDEGGKYYALWNAQAKYFVAE